MSRQFWNPLRYHMCTIPSQDTVKSLIWYFESAAHIALETRVELYAARKEAINVLDKVQFFADDERHIDNDLAYTFHMLDWLYSLDESWSIDEYKAKKAYWINLLYWEYMDYVYPREIELWLVIDAIEVISKPSRTWTICDYCKCVYEITVNNHDEYEQAVARRMGRDRWGGRYTFHCGCNKNGKTCYMQLGISYSDYLKTKHWHEYRKRKLAQAGYRCQLCNAKDTVLQVHHRTYENLGAEKDSDCIVLCKDCHTIFHENLEIEE